MTLWFIYSTVLILCSKSLLIVVRQLLPHCLRCNIVFRPVEDSIFLDQCQIHRETAGRNALCINLTGFCCIGNDCTILRSAIHFSIFFYHSDLNVIDECRIIFCNAFSFNLPKDILYLPWIDTYLLMLSSGLAWCHCSYKCIIYPLWKSKL